MIDEAEALVEAGRGQELLTLRALPVRVSAQTVASAYPYRDTFGMDKPSAAIERVRCPILAFYGTEEAWVGSADDLAVVQRNATAAPRVETRMIEGMTHAYAATGHHTAAATLISDWAGRLTPE